MKQITEHSVMDFYLDLIKNDQVKFLINREKKKKELIKLIKQLRETEEINDKILLAKDLWKVLFEAAMTFIDPDKQGYDELFRYFDEFVHFEELIFASDAFYRDHTLHSLWVYFLGEYIFRSPEFAPLFKDFDQDIQRSARVNSFYKSLNMPSIFGDFCQLLDNVSEILKHDDSIRCIAALAHDLGYPLKRIHKINRSIGKILPFFSISKFGEFDFQFENIQQFYIENLLELLSYDIDFEVELANLTFEESQLIREQAGQFFHALSAISNSQDIDEGLLQEIKSYLTNISEKEIHVWRKIFEGSCRLTKNMSRLLRFANDFENYAHGIMSSYLLMKILNAFSNIQLAYSDLTLLDTKKVDLAAIKSKLRILIAMADHTSPGFLMREFSDFSALLVLIDEIEEFSRISRANQYRQFINEFCKTAVGMENGYLCIDFVFDDQNIDDLNPEISFRDKCKKFLKIFDIPNLDPDLKIRFRCIGMLPQDPNTYQIEIARQFVKITINDEERDISAYLDTKEVFER
ncbi:MAG: hypothetical protein ACFFDI_30190 [Promethearchaeota archaeon]